MKEIFVVLGIVIVVVFVGKAFYDLGRAEGSVVVKREIRRALNELGVPGPGYPVPVANAVDILQGALNGDSADVCTDVPNVVKSAPDHSCVENHEPYGDEGGYKCKICGSYVPF